MIYALNGLFFDITIAQQINGVNYPPYYFESTANQQQVGIVASPTPDPSLYTYTINPDSTITVIPLSDEQLAENLAEAQAIAWANIQVYRDKKLVDGVFVSGYWIPTDSTSRSQWHALISLGDSLPEYNVTALDGTSITITPELAKNVYAATSSQDSIIAQNTLLHYNNMIAAADPSTYDFTTGWPLTYTLGGSGIYGNIIVYTTSAFTPLIVTNSTTDPITSNVTTGTAPFIVNSTTLVANLNSAMSNVATNLFGGNIGSLAYQTAANTTAMLDIGSTNDVLTVVGGLPSWQPAGAANMVYPGAGIPLSTGSAWDTSYSTYGSGNVILGTNQYVVLTSDATANVAVGGSGAITLATVNENTGQWGDASHTSQITVNGKGLITAAANVAIPNTVQLSGDVTSTSGTTSSNAVVTLNTVNANTGQWGDATHIPQFTVNGKGLVTAAGNVSISFPSQVYPGAGIAYSNGSAWLSSYATTGTGNVVLNTGAGGSIQSVPIGNATPSTGAFTTLSGLGTTLGLTTATALNSTIIGNSSAAAGTFTTLNATGTTTLVATNAGLTTAVALNSTPIGNSAPSSGAFTTLRATGTTTLVATNAGLTTATALNSTIIGNSTPSTGAFTTLSGLGTTLGLTTAIALNSTIIGNSAAAAATFTTLNSTGTATLVALNSGLTSAVALNSTPIGNATPSSGAFTTLSATGALSSSLSMNSTVIGNTTPAAGTFTTLTGVATTLGLTSAQAINSTIIGNSTPAAGTFTTLTGVATTLGLTSAQAINSTPIGNSTPNSGAFTTVSATGTTTLVATNAGLITAVALNSTPIGNSTPSSGAFTTISATGTTTLVALNSGLSTHVALNSTPIGNSTPSTGAFTTLSATGTTTLVALNSGLTSAVALNSTPIGNATPSTGVFTTLTGVATTLGLTSAQAINSTPIGNSTPSSGAFTTLSATSTTTLVALNSGLTTATALNSTIIGNSSAAAGTFTTITGTGNTSITGNIISSGAASAFYGSAAGLTSFPTLNQNTTGSANNASYLGGVPSANYVTTTTLNNQTLAANVISIVSSGNITAQSGSYFIGNGSQLSGITATATSANLATYVTTTSVTNNTAYPVLLSGSNTTGGESPLFDTDLNYNPSTDILTLPATGYFLGPLNGTVGATTANTGAFTTLSATSTTTLVALNSGLTSAVALNSTPIGNATPSTGVFTTLTGVATTLGLTSAQAINSTIIGNSSAAAGTFTTLTDSKGEVRTIVQNSQSGAYVLAATDSGKHISITTGGVTINTSVLTAGQAVSIYNNSASSQTITQGSGVTMYLAGTATTGNRTLAQRGICTILCVTSSTTMVISGAGLT